jgi:hypothetical protein
MQRKSTISGQVVGIRAVNTHFPLPFTFFATLARTLAGSTAAGSRRRIAAGVEEKAWYGPAQDTRKTA